MTGPEFVFVLVSPAVPANVGAAARAIKTMGFKQLRLVRPCDYLSPPARLLAHASGDILENAGVYGQLEEALSDVSLSVATTAKRRNVGQKKVYSRDIAGFIADKGKTLHRVAIVFGGEESGLTNEETRLCHVVSKIPLAAPYPSLNLAQAVMVYAYELSRFSVHGVKAKRFHTAPADSFNAMLQRVGHLMPVMGFRPGHPTHTRLMERIALLGKGDIELLHALLGRIENFSRGKPD